MGSDPVGIAAGHCATLDEDGDMRDHDIQEVGVSQSILDRARRSSLIANQSKFTRRAPARIGSLTQMDSFYTDAPLPPRLTEAGQRSSTQVIIARHRNG